MSGGSYGYLYAALEKGDGTAFLRYSDEIIRVLKDGGF